MPKHEQSKTAIILSGIGAILLMTSLYFIFRTNLPRLIAIIPLLITGCALTGYYKYSKFLPQTDPADPPSIQRLVPVSVKLSLLALAYGWLTRLIDFSQWWLVLGLEAIGWLTLLTGMTMGIIIRLRRFELRSD